MKSNFLVASMFSALTLLSGCAGTCPAEARTPSQVAETLPPPDKCEHRPCPDSFDDAGNLVASGGRFVYDASKKAVVWLTSEDMQARYARAWAATKAQAQRAYQVAEDAYEAHK